MSTGALVVVWGSAVRGREQHALEVFAEVLAFHARLQQAGEIDGFEPVALEPSGGDLAGLMIVRGDPERLARLRLSAEYQRLTNRSLHVVDHFGVHTGHVGEALQQIYADWGAQARQLAASPPAPMGSAYTPA